MTNTNSENKSHFQILDELRSNTLRRKILIEKTDKELSYIFDVQNKLFAAMGIPKKYITNTEDNNG
jgi:hypothetical protein